MQNGDLRLLEIAFWLGLISTMIVLGTGFTFLFMYLYHLVF